MVTGAVVAWLVLVGEVAVPLVLALTLPSRLAPRALAVVGLAVLVLLAYLGYRDSIVENGGDWNPGAEAATMALLVNAAVLVPLWLAGAAAGFSARRWIARDGSRGPGSEAGGA